ncbi:QacE family quaternary ammonium compound efflux SMR transporter [Ectothiorhodospira shaposhnikovii]|uniref:quaternary ammonium compound efflux SMR transporter SugE n=1 Tax=Ectothiorhodospira shaposhnikovii TaxID=1054 RepID=UPI00190698EB|nr:multidrug efflux SMR transporter [Ectothiorhodospira shaposhnikovii]MBK1671860.1 QacE family quaternary ammonium compound efflux SMR transporter [Ectothiorhodospira shaposhnikovii]
MNTAWFALVIAGLLEVVWAVGLKASDGFTRLWPSVFTLLAMSGSFWLLAQAMRSIPVGTAYAIWVGIGVVGTFIAGILLYAEALSLARVVSMLLIIIGLVGLKLAG